MTRRTLQNRLLKLGSLRYSVIEAFVEHLDSDADGVISVADCVHKLQRDHIAFPNLNEMFNDVARFNRARTVSASSLKSYLVERRKLVPVLDCQVDLGHDQLLTTRGSIVNFLSACKGLPEYRATSRKFRAEVLSHEVNKLLEKSASDSSVLMHLRKHVFPWDTCPSIVKLTNERPMYEYKRTRYWAEWIALIKKLEDNPLEPSESVTAADMMCVPVDVKYIRKPPGRFTPANPDVFKVVSVNEEADTTRENHTGVNILRDGAIDTEAIRLLYSVKWEPDSANTENVEKLTRVRHWPIADETPYIDAPHDQTTKPRLKDNGVGFICTIDRDGQRVKLEAARERLQDAEAYRPLRHPVSIKQSGPFKRRSPQLKRDTVEQAIRQIESISMEDMIKAERRRENQKDADGHFYTGVPHAKIKKAGTRPIAELWSQTDPNAGNSDRVGRPFDLVRPLKLCSLDKCYALRGEYK